MDELAGGIGVQPSLLCLLFTDYPLFKRIRWGPVTVYQSRSKGPGKWEGARGAIFTQFDRMYQPLKTRQVWNKLFFSTFLKDLHNNMARLWCICRIHFPGQYFTVVLQFDQTRDWNIKSGSGDFMFLSLSKKPHNEIYRCSYHHFLFVMGRFTLFLKTFHLKIQWIKSKYKWSCVKGTWQQSENRAQFIRIRWLNPSIISNYWFNYWVL